MRSTSSRSVAHRVFVTLIALTSISLSTSCNAVRGFAARSAVEKGHLSRVRAMVESHPDLVFWKDERGKTLLYWACLNDRMDIAALLIASKSDINTKDDNGDTPLHTAVYLDRKDVAEFLLAHGASVNSRDNHGETPLQLAAMMDHLAEAKVLLAHGADVNTFDNYGRTPLANAIQQDHTDLEEFLRRSGGHD